MAVDHLKNLRRLREILRKQRRKLVATMIGAQKEPTKFAPLVELQEACDAVEWALDDEAAAAKEGENNEPAHRGMARPVGFRGAQPAVDAITERCHLAFPT